MFNQSLNPRSVTFNLILINVLFFLANTFIGEKMVEYCALFYPASPYFKPMQLVTHMFMHANLMHIFSNMFALFMFGAILEKVWGPQRFLIFYFITGLGAALLHTGVQALIVYNYSGSVHPALSTINEYTQLQGIYASPTLGASGAVFGILVAFGMLFPNSELMLLFFPIPIKAKYFVSGYVVFELYEGIVNNPTDHIAHFAHLGGALFGFILVKLWNRNRDYLY
jgi:rhomboid family protein